MPSTTDAPLRLPEHIRAALRARQHRDTHGARASLHALLRTSSLSTVCEEARCPNIDECFSSGTATFMVCGDRCTRRCHFCDVDTKRPLPLDPSEPARVAEAAAALELAHVVITSVDRDDLADRGAGHWAAVIRAVAARLPAATVEVLVPDFGGDTALVDVVLDALPAARHVLNHNTETVERLYHDVRPQSDWADTARVLAHAKARGFVTKSGIMVGLGERDDEIEATLRHLAALRVDIVTIGQYLRPSLSQWPVRRYLDDEGFARLADYGRALGIPSVFAGAFVRSSYHAAEADRARASSASSSSSRSSLRVLP